MKYNHLKIIIIFSLQSCILMELLCSCNDDNWENYNGELGDCPWCENGLLEDLRDCPHCDNGILTKTQGCGSCYGTGKLKCTSCNGPGGEWVLGADGNYHFEDCKSCNGNGWKKCNVCNGKGYYFIDKLGYRSPF